MSLTGLGLSRTSSKERLVAVGDASKEPLIGSWSPCCGERSQLKPLALEKEHLEILRGRGERERARGGRACTAWERRFD